MATDRLHRFSITASLHHCITLAAMAMLACAPVLAAEQSYPSRPVRIVVPTSAGGATDSLSRAIAQRLAEGWSQPVVVENRPGANQIIGADHVAKSAPDGYTLLVSDASSFVMNPHLYRKLPYDGIRSFTPITVLVRFPWVIATHPSVPAGTFQELVKLAKARPGVLSYGSFGLGSSAHISVDYLKRLAGIDIVHVPYKGAAPAVTALLTGEISMMMVTPLLVEPHARSGKLKLIAAATPNRIAGLPDLPTVAESGVPGYSAGTWFGLAGPAGLPRETTSRIHGEVVRILNDPAFRERNITKQWYEAVGNTPEQFADYLKTEYERWDKLIKLSGVSVE
ncbi:MAG TPA: tripartite tricarboxylate transporter substrate binding protein [Burkholderiales bacterium]|nr:tripartite tricarboxylate transporter substrate binding protein [Burkholderiales bacterium]